MEKLQEEQRIFVFAELKLSANENPPENPNPTPFSDPLHLNLGYLLAKRKYIKINSKER